MLIAIRKKFLFWVKGEGKKSKAHIKIIDSKTLNATITLGDKLKKADIFLYSFVYSGLVYFGQAKVVKQSDNSASIDFQSLDLYKTERRDNYRLMAYPQYVIDVFVPLDNPQPETGNVVDFRTKVSETGLFKNFLEMMGDGEDKKGYIKFRAADLSSGGVGILAGSYESELFEEGQTFNGIIIKFTDDDEIVIAESKIVHMTEMIGAGETKQITGFEFTNISESSDNFIARKINETMREFSNDFEDFLNETYNTFYFYSSWVLSLIKKYFTQKSF